MARAVCCIFLASQFHRVTLFDLDQNNTIELSHHGVLSDIAVVIAVLAVAGTLDSARRA